MTESLDTLLQRREEANDAYHNRDNPIMTDAEYDALVRDILAQGGEITVGAPVSDMFAKVKHESPMLSLDNLFTEQDLIDWLLSRRVAPTDLIIAQCKADGLSMELRYEAGQLVQAVTRGDGEIGEDVTPQVRTIKNIPDNLSSTESFRVRGEVVMPTAAFLKFNEELKAKGKKPLANPRNAAAGAIRQKNVKETAKRDLKFLAFSLISDDPSATEWEDIGKLTDHGFLPVWTELREGTPENVYKMYQNYESKRAEIGYDIDGVVYKIDNKQKQKSLGMTSRSPKWAVAHKFTAEKAITVLSDVDWQVGRTGLVTPVARLSPVNVGGVVVSNATLHNPDEIMRLDIQIGDKVTIQRAGDVIPQVLGVAEKAPLPETIQIPMQCPSCGSDIKNRVGEVAIRCDHTEWCPAQQQGRLEHFVSRNAMNIDGVGPAQLKDMVKYDFIQTPLELFQFADKSMDEWFPEDHEGDMTPVIEAMELWDGWGKTSVKKCVAAIERARKVDLHRFIYALGIAHIGQQTAKDIAGHFGSVEAFFRAVYNPDLFQECRKVDGIGDAVLNALMNYFDDDEKAEQVFDLRIALDIQEPPKVDESLQTFTGMTVVFTGGLNRYSRDACTVIVEDLGGKVTGSVSKKTTMLVCGDNTGAVKIAGAEKNGTRCITEDEFLAMVDEAVSNGYEPDVME